MSPCHLKIGSKHNIKWQFLTPSVNNHYCKMTCPKRDAGLCWLSSFSNRKPYDEAWCQGIVHCERNCHFITRCWFVATLILKKCVWALWKKAPVYEIQKKTWPLQGLHLGKRRSVSSSCPFTQRSSSLVSQSTIISQSLLLGVLLQDWSSSPPNKASKNMPKTKASWTTSSVRFPTVMSGFFDVAQLFLSKGNSPSKSPGSASPWCGNSLFCFTFCRGFLEFYHLRGKHPTSMPRFPQQISWPVWRLLDYCCPFTSCGLAISWGGVALGGRLRFPENRRKAMRPVRNKACAVIQIGDDF